MFVMLTTGAFSSGWCLATVTAFLPFHFTQLSIALLVDLSHSHLTKALSVFNKAIFFLFGRTVLQQYICLAFLTRREKLTKYTWDSLPPKSSVIAWTTLSPMPKSFLLSASSSSSLLFSFQFFRYILKF